MMQAFMFVSGKFDFLSEDLDRSEFMLNFSREGDSKAEPETCHRQDVRESDFPVKSKAVLTPCYNYNVYLQVEEGAISLRSTPKKIKSNGEIIYNYVITMM